MRNFDLKRLSVFLGTILLVAAGLLFLIFGGKEGGDEKKTRVSTGFPQTTAIEGPREIKKEELTKLGGVHQVERKREEEPQILGGGIDEVFNKPFQEVFVPLFGTVKPFLLTPKQPKITPSEALAPQTAATPRKPLTEKEIFDQIWPPSYIQALKPVEKLMRDDGFIQPTQIISFSSDKDMYEFLKLEVDYAEKKGWITTEDASRFRYGLGTILPQTIVAEKAALYRGQAPLNLVPGKQKIARDRPAKVVLKDLLDGLKYVFSLANPADAAWIRGVVCYKDDAPFYAAPGFNGGTFCCNCGLICDPEGCFFVPDCGEGGAICDIQLGCLNKVCGGWPNAIWNPATGICGCG